MNGGGRCAHVKYTAEFGCHDTQVGFVENVIKGDGSNASQLGTEWSDSVLLFNLVHLDCKG